MTILFESMFDIIMLFVNHAVADIINEGLTINNEFDFRIIKDDTNVWFRDYDTEWCRQDLDQQNNI